MRCHIGLFVLTTLVCSVLLVHGQPGYSQPQAKKVDPVEVGKIFKQLCRDKDTLLIADQPSLRGKEEMELFAWENSITNGQLTQDQFLKYYEQRDELLKKTAKDPKKIAILEAILNERATFNFRRFDLNDDGFWNPDEIVQLKNNFAPFKDEWQKWDANKDGLIDLNEFQIFYRDWSKRNKERQANAKTKPKAPSKIIIEEEEDENRPLYHHAGQKLPEGLPKWFIDLDLNNDGQLSLFEWQKGGRKVAEFLKMDRNDDGYLTAEEILLYLKKPIELNSTGPVNFQGAIEATDIKYQGKKLSKIFIIRLDKDKTYQIDHSSKVFQAFLYLEGADGKRLKENSSAKVGANSRIVFRPAKTGTYRLIATSLGSEKTGAFSLSVRVLDPIGKDEDGRISLHEWKKGSNNLDEFRHSVPKDDGFITAAAVLPKGVSLGKISPEVRKNLVSRQLSLNS